MHPVLAELMQRAGASDTDKPAWLAERLGGVTATEIRELYFGGPTYRRELIEIKLGIRQDSFSGNQYTAWGKKREPIIASWVQSRFAVTPESRVFRAKSNARHLASPDGVAVSFDGSITLAEIKTSKHDISKGTDIFRKYYVQIIWQMHVMGAVRCVYAFEQHDDDWRDVGGQYPEPRPLDEPRTEWVHFDEKLAAELIELADGFLAELDAARVALEAGEGPVIDEELDTLAVNLLRFREMESDGKKAKESAWADLQSALAAKGTDFSQESTLARITYTAAVDGTADGLDQEAAIAADPKLWASVERAEKALAKKRAAWAEHAKGFTKSVPSTKKAGLTVTSVKPPKEKKA